MYALKLNDDNRILSATYLQYAPADAILVDVLPEGDVSDYLYVSGEYVYDPLPVPEPDTTPTNNERLDALEAAMLELILAGG